MTTGPYRRLLNVAGAVILAMIPAAGSAAADTCDGNEVMQILGTAEATNAYQQCVAKEFTFAFAETADKLIESLELLYDFSVDPAAPMDPTLPMAAAGVNDEMVQLKYLRSALGSIKWTAAGAATQAGDQIAQATEIVNRLTAPLTPVQSSSVAASHRISFCDVKLNWKLTKLWSSRAKECNSCTQNCPP